MGGTAGQSVTLANSIIGVGILAMPFCFQQCGAVLAVVMLLLSGLVSRLACYFLLKSAIMARRTNFEFLAFHVFGAPGKLAVEVGIIGFLMGTCIAYFVVVGDLGPQIICKMFNINQSDVLRTCVMVLVSVVCVLPLGLLRNVDSLSNVSAATIGFYVCLVIKVIVEATSQLINGDWQSKIELWKPEGVLQCVPIFSMALFCQTQLFEIFETLPTLSLEKMNVVTKNALNICTAVYVMVGSFGYLAFCGQTISGNILVSLSPTMASDVIKLGFVMSLAFSFPLIIFPCRASIYSLLYRKVLPSQHDHIINHSIPEGTFRCITVAIIGVALLVSLMIPNIELVLGLVGSTIGVLVCVIFPAACFVNVTLKNTNERVLAKVILCLGIIVMVLGTYANLQAAESKLDHTDNRYITEDRIDKIVQEFIKSNEQNIKLQDVIITPETKAAEGAVAQSKNIVQKAADSEVQPPNPVAPDSQPEETKKIDTQPQIPAVIVKEDSKYKLDHNDIEGGGDKESLTIAGDSKVKSEEKYSNIKETEKDHVRNGAVADTVVNQKSLDLLKQQELIDTIKRHGEEQKQLMEEQRDILDNLKKTQLEIEKTKKDNIDKEQVKKIAVESIKKMADIAIQSISGVTDTPIEVAKPEKSADNKVDKKIIDDPAAILKKAVETIEAIGKEEKPVLPAINGLPLSHSGMINDKSHDGNQVQSDAQKEANISAMSGNGSKINIDIVDSNNNKAEVVDNMNNKETHIHSPDEPNSYIQGENLELLKQGVVQQKLSPSSVDALVNNVPVPIVMNQNLQNNPSIINEILNSKESKIVSNLQLNNGLNNAQEILENGNINKKISREKRYINCENQVFMSDEEQRKCRNVIILNDINILVPQKLSVPEDVYLGKVDLIPPSYSVDPNVLHQVRSLKSVDELESS